MIRVVAAYIERGGKVLLAQRKPGKHLAGSWEFPGGKTEPGESDEAALERELDEELGTRAEVTGPPIAEVEHAYPAIAIRLVLYPVRLLGEREPVAIDAAAIDWVPVASLGAIFLSPADRKLVDAIEAARARDP